MDFLMEHGHPHMYNDFESLKIAMAQYYGSLLTKLKDHIDDSNVHVTLEEKDRWNKKADKLNLEEIELKVMKKANISDIPTLISELKNDVPYLTAASLLSKLQELDYVTWADLKYKDYITADEVNRLIRNVVIDPTNINLYGYVKKDELATINGQRLYNGGNIVISGGSGTGTISEVPLASDTVRGGIKTGFVKTGNKFPVKLNGERAYVEIAPTDITIDPSVIDVDFSDVQRQIDDLNTRLSNFITQWNAITDEDLARVKADALAQIDEAMRAIEDAKRTLYELFGDSEGETGDAGVIINKLNGLVSMFADYWKQADGEAYVTHIKDTIDAELASITQSIEYINAQNELHTTWESNISAKLGTLEQNMKYTIPGIGQVTTVGLLWNAVEGKMTQYVTHDDLSNDITNEVKTTLNGMDPSWSTVVAQSKKGEKAYGVLLITGNSSTVLNEIDTRVGGLITDVNDLKSSSLLFAGIATQNPDGTWNFIDAAYVLALFDYVNNSSSINLKADHIYLDGTTHIDTAFANAIIAEYLAAATGYFTLNIMIGDTEDKSIYLGTISGTGTNTINPIISVRSYGEDDIFDISTDNGVQAVTHFGYDGSGWIANKNIQWNSEGKFTALNIEGNTDFHIKSGNTNVTFDQYGLHTYGPDGQNGRSISVGTSGISVDYPNGSAIGKTGYVEIAPDLFLLFDCGIFTGAVNSVSNTTYQRLNPEQ